MAQLRIAYTRLRVEEKLLFEAAQRLGIPVAADDVEDRSWPGIEADPGDVVLCRCIGQTHNIALAQLLESRGIRTINHSSVIALCGDKVTTAAILSRAGVPQPEYMVAFSPEGAVDAAEKMGYPVVFKPPVGSWGRLLAKVDCRETAEAVAEHKSHLGPSHSVYFLQKYVEKGGYDVRVTLVNGEPVTAIRRKSDHWITNTARGGVPEGISVTDEMASILRRTYEAVGGDILAVDLFLGPDGWLVNEINGQPEFRSSITTTGVDLPGLILKHAQSCLEAQR